MYPVCFIFVDTAFLLCGEFFLTCYTLNSPSPNLFLFSLKILNFYSKQSISSSQIWSHLPESLTNFTGNDNDDKDVQIILFPA